MIDSWAGHGRQRPLCSMSRGGAVGGAGDQPVNSFEAVLIVW